jgi:hypothetical protein
MDSCECKGSRSILTFCFFRQTKLCGTGKIKENSSLDVNNNIKHHSIKTTNKLQLDSCGRLQERSSIPDPRSRSPDPTKATKEEGEKFVFLPFFVATNFKKCKLFYF